MRTTFSSSLQHLKNISRLHILLECIRTAGLQLNSKNSLACREIQILRHTVSSHGLRPDLAKINAVSEFPRPINVKQLKRFLGPCSYFRCFIQQFADRAAPLVTLSPRKHQSNEQKIRGTHLNP